jgi:hypothetical protein
MSAHDRLQYAERRTTAAETARQVAQLERQVPAVFPSPPQQAQNMDIVNDDRLEVMDGDCDDEKQQHRQQPQQQQTQNSDTANKGSNNRDDSSLKQPSQRQRCRVVVVVVAVLVAAAAAAAAACGTGHCSSPTTVPTRADIILSYINGITLSRRILTYPSIISADERAVQWLIEDDLGTDVADEQTLRQRFALATLWFLEPTPLFKMPDYAASWTTNLDECEWLNVRCDANGRVTALELFAINLRGQITNDLGLLTRLT